GEGGGGGEDRREEGRRAADPSRPPAAGAGRATDRPAGTFTPRRAFATETASSRDRAKTTTVDVPVWISSRRPSFAKKAAGTPRTTVGSGVGALGDLYSEGFRRQAGQTWTSTGGAQPMSSVARQSPYTKET